MRKNGKIAPFRGQGKGAWPICKRHYAARSPLSFPAFGDLFLCTLFHSALASFIFSRIIRISVVGPRIFLISTYIVHVNQVYRFIKKNKMCLFITRNNQHCRNLTRICGLLSHPINKSISPRERAVSNCIVGTDKLLKTKVKQKKSAIIERVINYRHF